VAIVGSAVLISVPPLNAIIHGTYAVTGHAMGATIGIDTMILLGAVIWIVGEYLRGREGEDASNPLHCARMRWSVIGLNVGVALLVGWLHLAGVVTGLTRMRLAPSEVYVPPAWLGASSGIMFSATGTLAFVFFSSILVTLIPCSFRSFRTEASA
jgi:heme/copper-type cytochrome/quinol oxidase subunit 1